MNKLDIELERIKQMLISLDGHLSELEVQVIALRESIETKHTSPYHSTQPTCSSTKYFTEPESLRLERILRRSVENQSTSPSHRTQPKCYSPPKYVKENIFNIEQKLRDAMNSEGNFIDDEDEE